jgi:hypothetical protein
MESWFKVLEAVLVDVDIDFTCSEMLPQAEELIAHKVPIPKKTKGIRMICAIPMA